MKQPSATAARARSQTPRREARPAASQPGAGSLARAGLPGALSAADLAVLQRSLGNRAIQRLLRRGGQTPARPGVSAGRIQRLRIKLKGRGELNTDTETDIGKLEEWLALVKRPESIRAIQKRIQWLQQQPFLGYQPSKSSKKPPANTVMHEEALVSKKTSKADGQKWRTAKADKDFTPLTVKESEKKLPKAKIGKLEQWKGQPLRLKWFKEMMFDQAVLVPYIQCTYTLEWIRAEEADLDHVVPTKELKQHLRNIAARMNADPDLMESVKAWLEGYGLSFEHWFIKGIKKVKNQPSQTIYKPTRWAMYELHNNPGNLVFSSKIYNQNIKNEGDAAQVILKNPWFGAAFFSQHTLLTANAHLSNEQGRSTGVLLEEFIDQKHQVVSERLAEIKKNERRMVLDAKQIALKKKGVSSEKFFKRKQQLISSAVEAETDTDSDTSMESDDERDGQARLLLSVAEDLGVKEIVTQSKEFETLTRERDAVVKERDRFKNRMQEAKKEKKTYKDKYREKRNSLKQSQQELEEARRKIALLEEELKQTASHPKQDESSSDSTLSGDDSDRDEERKQIKHPQNVKKQQVNNHKRKGDWSAQQNHPHSLEPSNKKQKLSHKPTNLAHPTVLSIDAQLQQLDKLNKETFGTNKQRMQLLKSSYATYHAFEQAYISRLIIFHYHADDRNGRQQFQQYQNMNPNWLPQARKLLQTYYNSVYK